jgi:hypothetical protein
MTRYVQESKPHKGYGDKTSHLKSNLGFGQGIGLKRESSREKPQGKAQNLEKNKIKTKNKSTINLTNAGRKSVSMGNQQK